MSTIGYGAMYASNGLPFIQTPTEIKDLPPDLRTAAKEVWEILWDQIRIYGTTLDEALTNARMAAWIAPGKGGHGHRCQSHVAKGLWVLEYVLGWIKRVRQGGRRVIQVIVKLLGREREAVPSQTLPGKREETPSTQGRSLSSLSRPPENPDKPDHAELVARAIALPRDVKPTSENVRAAILAYGAEWVERAVSDGEARKKDPVRNWSLITITLEAWKASGGPPEAPKPPVDPIIEREIRKAREREQAAQDAAKEAEIQGIWDSLSEEQRQEIRGQVERENPALRRNPVIIKSLCLTRAAELAAVPSGADGDPRAP